MLLLVAMQRLGLEVAAELVRELVAHALGAAEDDDARARWLGAQDRLQLPHLVIGLDQLHELHIQKQKGKVTDLYKPPTAAKLIKLCPRGP